MRRTFFKSSSVLLTSLFITACSSDNDVSTPTPTPEPPPPPPANTAPVASMDMATAADNEPVSINVLANDTDADGDALSISEISAEPENGSVSIDGDAVVYTPNAFFAGTDTFSYVVSDGEDTAEAQVMVSSTQSIVLSGVVTDSPIANATVTVNFGDEAFTAQADENGDYQLTLTVSDDSAQLMLSAVGSEDNGQGGVELISYVGSAAELLPNLNTDRLITSEMNNATNVTHVSTARLLLVQEQNDGQMPTSAEEFAQLTDQVNAEELINLAAFINLLVDNPTYPIPAGESTLSLLQREGAASVEEAIDGYLADNGALDEEGEPTEQYLADLDEAVQMTLSNPAITSGFSADRLAGADIVAIVGNIRAGFIPTNGDVFELENGASGSTFLTFFGAPTVRRTFEWEVEQGELVLTFDESASSVGFPFFSNEQIEAIWGAEAAAAVLMFPSPSGQSQVITSIIDQRMRPISVGASRAQVISEQRQERTLVVTEDLQFTVADEPIVQNLNLLMDVNPAFAGMAADDVIGTWALPLEYTFVGEVDGQPSRETLGVHTDMVTLNADGSASARNSGLDFTWQFAEGTLTLVGPEQTFEITPIIDNGGDQFALVHRTEQGEISSRYVRNMAPFSDTFDTAEQMQADLPLTQLTLINGHLGELYDGDLLNLGSVFAFAIRPSGEMTRVFPRGSDPLFAEDSFLWSWSVDIRETLFRANESSFVRERRWQHISTDANGRSLVIEQDLSFNDNDGDGTFGDSFIVIPPRIQILQQQDLSEYEEAWENTLGAQSLRDLPETP